MFLIKTGLYLLLLILLGQNFTITIKAQSYIIKPLLPLENELIAGTGLTAVKLESLSINNSGEVIVLGDLSDGTKGIIYFSNDNLKLLVKSITAQPLNENVVLGLGTVDIIDNGDIFFCGHISPDKLGIFKILNNDIIPLALIGDAVNGVASSIEEFNCFPNTFQFSSNNKGEIVFNATLSDKRRGLFELRDKTIEPILLEGDIFSLFNGNATLIIADSGRINDKGEIVFRASYFTDAFNEQVNQGIFLYIEDNIIPVKVPGQEAPGTGGKVFSRFHFEHPALGNNSDVVFYGDYLSPEAKQPPGFIPWLSEFGLFLWSKENVWPIALTGDPAPGANGFFQNANGALALNIINDFRDIVFHQGSNNAGGIYLFSNSNIIPVFLREFVKFPNLNPG